MSFLDNFRKERELNKKVNQAREDIEVKQQSKEYTKLGLSEEDAEFLARKDVKKEKRKESMGKIFKAIENVGTGLEAPDPIVTQPEPEPKQKKKTQKHDQKHKQKNNYDVDSEALMNSFFYKN